MEFTMCPARTALFYEVDSTVIPILYEETEAPRS